MDEKSNTWTKQMIVMWSKSTTLKTKNMKEQIYKFLDYYLGNEVKCRPIPTNGLRTWTDNYEIVSNNGTIIFWFSVRLDAVKMFRSEELCKKLEGYFSVEPENSWKYIRDWFGERYQMKTLADLFKFIPHVSNS